MIAVSENKRDRATSAFTIVELLIVVVVIAILAALTLVTYRGIQDRARASSVTQGLSQAKKKLELYKVDHAAYPLTGGLASAGVVDSDVTYQYTSTDGGSYCLTGVSGNAVYQVTAMSAPVNGGCNGHSWNGGVSLTNLVTNGDFSQGSTGLGAPSGGVGAVSASQGVATFMVGSGVAQVQVPFTAIPATYDATHQYYRYIKFRVSSKVGLSFVLLYAGSSFYSNNSSIPAAGQWYEGSTVITPNGSLSTSYVRFTYASAAEAAGQYVDVDSLLIIDLTAAFGAGSEPTKAQMDAIMQQFPDRWFNGTVTADTRGIL